MTGVMDIDARIGQHRSIFILGAMLLHVGGFVALNPALHSHDDDVKDLSSVAWLDLAPLGSGTPGALSEPRLTAPPQQPKPVVTKPEKKTPSEIPQAPKLDNALTSDESSESVASGEAENANTQSEANQAAGPAGGGTMAGDGLGGAAHQPPVAPNLKRKLEYLYPKDARSAGQEGSAMVTLVLQNDGLPQQISVTRETPPGFGFGEACTKTLAQERWKPAKNFKGEPIAVRLNYTCRFLIRD